VLGAVLADLSPRALAEDPEQGGCDQEGFVAHEMKRWSAEVASVGAAGTETTKWPSTRPASRACAGSTSRISPGTRIARGSCGERNGDRQAKVRIGQAR